MTELSKVFDCLSHDLFIAKLHAYGIDLLSLKLRQDYLSNRWKRTKIDSKFSSILCSILFNILICDMFLYLHEEQFTGYADGNTHFVVRDNIRDVISALEEIGEKLLIWISDNEMKLNTNKCYLLLNTQDQNLLKIGNFNKKNSIPEKLPGITFDCKLNFSNHIEHICKKATGKLNALSRIVPYMDISRRKILMNIF